MEVRRISLLGGVLLLACAVSAQQVSSGNNATSGSGSGSGSGYSMARDCASLRCSHNCTETTMGPMCFCPAGYQLGSDDLNCQPCPGGYWGLECGTRCDCGQGNGCDRETGMCICNSCWQLDTNTMNCTTLRGYDCFLEFLAIPDKNVVDLRDRYGGDAYPRPREEDIDNLVASGLMNVQSQVIQRDSIQLEEISRENVMQGPLVKLSWRVDYNFDRPQAMRGLDDLEEKVKLGDVRSTLVIQDKQDYADVTLNAGTKQETSS